jgi:hypothetical protein
MLIRFTIALCLLSAQGVAQEAAPRWFKGNTHTHTLNSDGDSTPDEVVRWYREHGYHFLVLTDHNFLTSVDGLNALHGASGKFLVIPGEEVTDRFGEKPIHVNGLNLKRFVEPQGGASTVETVQRNVDAVRAAEGIPHINHPNFGWAISAEDLKKIRNDKLLEIFNGHPLTNNLGGGGRPGMEEVWDLLLTSGRVIYGIAVDDAHHFKRPWDRNASHPGRGWVVVRAPELSAIRLMEAMERGDFYASTGVELSDYTVTDDAIAIAIRSSGDVAYTTRFIGSGGAVLAESTSNPAVYRREGSELYVRAKVIDSNGNLAWTQPVFRSKR